MGLAPVNAKFLLVGVVLLAGMSDVRADLAPKSRTLAGQVSCQTIEQSARSNQLSVATLMRLLWHESRFEPNAISRAGAQGVAQFMPGTANERGLTDPFDPQQAIPEAARFIIELGRKFGNIGLAVAAYNAGPGRVASWLDGTRSLPRETENFVRAVTGRGAEEWLISGNHTRSQPESKSCTELRSVLRNARSSDGAYDSRWLPGLERSGRVLPSVKHSGGLLAGMEQSGRLQPDMRQSGRPLHGVERSGRVLVHTAQARY